MLAILFKNLQSPKFTPRQYFILYGISEAIMKHTKILLGKHAARIKLLADYCVP